MADSKGGSGGSRPLLALIFLKSRFFHAKSIYILLCSFAINEDGADKLFFAFLFKIFWSATEIILCSKVIWSRENLLELRTWWNCFRGIMMYCQNLICNRKSSSTNCALLDPVSEYVWTGETRTAVRQFANEQTHCDSILGLTSSQTGWFVDWFIRGNVQPKCDGKSEIGNGCNCEFFSSQCPNWLVLKLSSPHVVQSVNLLTMSWFVSESSSTVSSKTGSCFPSNDRDIHLYR